jgi:hypothetical protein
MASGSELQSSGTQQSVSHWRISHGKGHANIAASSNFCPGGNSQNVPEGSGFSDRVNNKSGHLGNSTASHNLSDKGSSETRSLASSVASDRLSDEGNIESRSLASSVASGRLFDKGSSESGSPANSAASDRLPDAGNNESGPFASHVVSDKFSDKGNNDSESSASGSIASDRLSDGGCAQSEPASSSLSRSENNCVFVANSTATSSLANRGNNHCGEPLAKSIASLRDKGNSERGSLGSSAGSDRLSDGRSAVSEPASSSLSVRENNCVLVAHSTEANRQNGTGSNNVFDSRSNKTQPLACTATSTSVSDRENNKYGSSRYSTAGGSVSEEENGLSGQPAVVDIPASLPLKARMKGINKQSSRLTVKQIMSNVTQNDVSGAASTSSTESRSIGFKNGLMKSYSASGDHSHVAGVLRQENRMSSADHTVQTHVTHMAAENEPPEKTVPGQGSTHDTLRTGSHDEVTLRTYRKRTSDAKSTDRSEGVEVFGCTNDVHVGAEVCDAEDAHIIENVAGRKAKCDISSGVVEKLSSSYSNMSGSETGFASNLPGDEGNSSTAEVMNKPSEETDIMILKEFVRVPTSTAESSRISSSLNDISADMTKEATRCENNRVPESEVEVVSSFLHLSNF